MSDIATRNKEGEVSPGVEKGGRRRDMKGCLVSLTTPHVTVTTDNLITF